MSIGCSAFSRVFCKWWEQHLRCRTQNNSDVFVMRKTSTNTIFLHGQSKVWRAAEMTQRCKVLSALLEDLSGNPSFSPDSSQPAESPSSARTPGPSSGFCMSSPDPTCNYTWLKHVQANTHIAKRKLKESKENREAGLRVCLAHRKNTNP